MLELLRREYTWPNIRTDVKDYVNSCVSCKRNKNPRHKPFGLIQQLPIPPQPWHSIAFDLIKQLPTSNGHTAILNVVDRASKQLISIPTNDKVTAPKIAKLFLQHVFTKHGVPLHVTCDCGLEFTSQFFRSLGNLLNINLHFTSGYNPQADGQSERANQMLEQYLWHYCSYQQDNWSDLLPLAEFAYNNAPNASTSVSPFFANKGYHPALDIHPERDVASLHA
jgi:IS30 family transposase